MCGKIRTFIMKYLSQIPSSLKSHYISLSSTYIFLKSIFNVISSLNFLNKNDGFLTNDTNLMSIKGNKRWKSRRKIFFFFAPHGMTYLVRKKYMEILRNNIKFTGEISRFFIAMSLTFSLDE